MLTASVDLCGAISRLDSLVYLNTNLRMSLLFSIVVLLLLGDMRHFSRCVISKHFGVLSPPARTVQSLVLCMHSAKHGFPYPLRDMAHGYVFIRGAMLA